MLYPMPVLQSLALAPTLLLILGSIWIAMIPTQDRIAWRRFNMLAGTAWLCALVSCALQWTPQQATASATGLSDFLTITPLGAVMAVLVQTLGITIGAFSSRYLQGEAGQIRYIAALAGVLASVHLLLLANHWLVLIAAWASIGLVLQRLLCFYPNRPFARLAAHKKAMADRTADVLLILAAALAWTDAGSGSFHALWEHLASGQVSLSMQISAAFLVFAVLLRTGLMPAHGWLTQVMEAPTPVSALLHAGVINLGGFVLIRFAPLLEAAPLARWILITFGLGTAVLAGMVILTRVSIKVRLAWSTVAQMGFMVLECGLGLYTLAALHLFGHSVYKAHAFLSASTVVLAMRHEKMGGLSGVSKLSLVSAPIASLVIVVPLLQSTALNPGWPWWWSVVLALAWSPLLWLPTGSQSHMQGASLHSSLWSAMTSIGLVLLLTLLALLAHKLPLGLLDRPDGIGGMVALIMLALMYLALVLVQWQARLLERFRRWSYAGFYVDELYTRLALKVWPGQWALPSAQRSWTKDVRHVQSIQ